MYSYIKKISLALLLIGTSLANAKDFKSGILLGINASQVDGDQNGGYNKLGLQGGFFVSQQFWEKSGLQLEILYSQKGSQSKSDPNNPGQILLKYRYGYAETQLLWFRKISRLRLHTGVSFARLTSAEFDGGGGMRKMTDIKKWDYLWNLGAELKISKKWSAAIKGQYSLSTIRLAPKAQNSQFRRTGVYHNLFSFSLRYNFNEDD